MASGRLSRVWRWFRRGALVVLLLLAALVRYGADPKLHEAVEGALTRLREPAR